MSHPLHIVVVTGMSGAGRSTALHVLEDLGFYCVDNLPPPVVVGLLELLAQSGELKRIALGIDVRTGSFLEGTSALIEELRARGRNAEVIFLDASDEALMRRFSETRRPHPMAPGGDVFDAIQRERERLAPLRALARHIFDTTRLSVHDLRSLLVDYIAAGEGAPLMVTRIVSFGFKYGLPTDADLVFDLRYLPNPHFVPALKPKTGLDPDVARFVLDTDEGKELLAELTSLLSKTLPKYEREGKAYLTIAVGCTGGRHRSVAIAEALRDALGDEREITVHHRDAAR